ncbi:U6 small nuclear RNA (adenine-(43)-N(6))-methyltransferase-like [Centruroides sculpturatus]|uniref:U6 small nuclear RNA (adenine-(43)-N(6))-methyltransferase-like n=1 Tax=Centruroides sculpturatus TaxID=218467 RepID=UPI000C6D3156|nr:U6 small nuclear RNA (adenine-(43)-N(6))-methyltransferase-like [Centruroides sculpturatus]
MSFNKFMHPRNIYRNPPNFKELSIKYPEFRQFAIQDLAGKIRIDFKDPNALRMLTTILLKNDFQLSVEIPPDHLIPTLPQRLNYILWIEDLLESFPKQKDDIIGIDIGTGACCIYPLLGCKVKSWKFLATEINEESFDWAIKNINANNMQNQIKVIKVNSNNILQDVISNEEICFDFTMCNPPFFNDQNDMSVKISRTPRRSLPKSINTPSETEKSTEGGEIEFIKKMIDESFLLKEKIIQFITCEFCQGNTMRWGIAWTFSSDVQFQKVPSLRHHKQKPPIAYLVPKSKNFKYTVESVASVITKLLEEIKVSYQIVSRSKNNIHLCLKAKENTWSHQRRKRRQLLRQQKIKENSSSCSDKLEDSTTIENSVDEKDEVPMETEDSCINKCIEDIEIEENINTDKTNEDEVSLKRERTSSDSFEEIEPKRVKLETNYDENCESFADYSDYDMDDIKEKSDQYVLYCDLSVKRGGRNIFLNLQCSSEMNREPMHQVLQYFKNKLM